MGAVQHSYIVDLKMEPTFVLASRGLIPAAKAELVSAE
jgi:hypothetical protein